MDISSNNKVNNLLADIQSLSSEQFDMVITIRDMFFSSNGCLVEGVKYGGIVFNLSNNLIGGIFSYKNHISIEFSNGTSFTDVNSILDGNGKKRRHLKIHSKNDITNKNTEYFIDQASNG